MHKNFVCAVVLGLTPCGCARKEEPPPFSGNTVSGKVRYRGDPVPYGYVLFFQPGKNYDLEKKTARPVAFGEIRDGKYEMVNVPGGPVMVCIASDPDVFAGELTGPRDLETGATLAGAAGPGPPPIPKVGDAKAPTLPKEPPGLPPLPKGIPGARGGPDPKAGLPGLVNPMTEKLTSEQKRTLREIHSKYGIFGKSPLAYVVQERQQTFDVDLK